MAMEDGMDAQGRADDWETLLLKAFTHPLRRRIFRHLEAAPAALSPRELSGILGQSLSNVSYHVRVLAKADAIVCVYTEPVRGSMQHFYRIGPKVAGVAWLAAYLDGSG